MAWIESHQALGQHPKTQQFATLLKVSMPTAVGHLHYFWWWALDFAPTGAIPNPTPTLVAHASQWKGDPERFWLAMIQAGFVEVNEDHVSIHDWLDYAGKLMARRAANRTRQRKHRNAEESVTADPAETPVTRDVRVTSRAGHALVTGLPTGPTGDSGAVSLTDQPQTPCDSSPNGAADGAPPRRASPRKNDEPAVIHAEAGVCPFCRVPYTGSYLEHTAEKHRVHAHAEPGNLGSALSRRRRGETPQPPPPEVEAQFAAMHERLQQRQQEPSA